MSKPEGKLLDEYHALRDAAGYVELAGRTQVELRGEDRVRFLHAFCTNDIKRLAAGRGCEAFLTSVQGRILGHVIVFCGDESLVLETVPGQADRIIEHLDRYLIREQVEFVDRTAEWSELLVAGRGAADLLARVAGAVPTELYEHTAARVAGVAVSLRRVAMAGPESFLLSGSAERMADVAAALAEAGAAACSVAAWEMIRIESGWPHYAVDITDRNLPQEVGRDRLAISFTKGCYLGQETVARIDALGHVNWLLRGFALQTEQLPDPGSELKAGEKVVGRITSVAWSPRLDRPLAMGYVRREHAQPATRLQSPVGPTEVVQLPLA